jgi:hypothetical protein
MYRELLKEIENDPKYEGLPLEFREPATSEQIKNVEQTLGVIFPDDLRLFVSETNGLYERYEDGRQFKLVYSLDYIAEINLYYRTDAFCADNFMPFENLLFFAQPGVDGVKYAFPITANGKAKEDIFVWWPQNDTRQQIAFASSLGVFLKQWLMGQLEY